MINPENIDRIKELFTKEIISAEGLTIAEVLELQESHGKREVEEKLTSMLEFHIKKTDELIVLLYDSKEFLKLEIKLKLACITNEIIKIVEFGKNGR